MPHKMEIGGYVRPELLEEEIERTKQNYKVTQVKRFRDRKTKEHYAEITFIIRD